MFDPLAQHTAVPSAPMAKSPKRIKEEKRLGKAPRESSQDTQVLVPQNVEVPIPKEPLEEIAIPASINGHDLSKEGP